jgi:hypothetical protein
VFEIGKVLKDAVIHNPQLYTDEENLKWCWLRAIEWGECPLFLGQLIGPIMLFVFPWWSVLLAVVILTWAWALVRYRFVSIGLGGLGPWVTVLKWPVSIGIGIAFLMRRDYQPAIVSSLWPLITLGLMRLTPKTKIGFIQMAFMKKLGYENPTHPCN